MTTRAVSAVLRGGPNHGLKVIALFDPQRRAIDSVSHSGYTYRDSGHCRNGLQIYDWLPASGLPACREVPRPAAAQQG